MEPSSPSRRRGDRLMESIYEATTEIIRKEGYANLTFQKIARASHTSRTVLYRRWVTPLDLIREILTYRSAQVSGGDSIDNLQDTGSLRGDLLALITAYQRFYTSVGPEIMNAVLFEISRNNPQIPALRKNAVFRNTTIMGKVVGFAKARGETVKPLSPAALTLPFDLIRIGNLWGIRAFDEAALEQLVDEILLPVFKAEAPRDIDP